MQSRDLIRRNLLTSVTRVLERVEDMREHALVYPTPMGGCHTLWVLGHLAYIEAHVIRHFMLGEANPLASWEPLFDGADPADDLASFPSFDHVLATCRETRRFTLTLLDTLAEDDLDRTSARAPGGATWRTPAARPG